MQAQATRTQLGLGPVFLAAALVIGALGGFAARGYVPQASGATSVQAGSAAVQTVLLPRSAGEDDALSNTTALIPRSAHEDDSYTAILAPAPRWTHEDDTTK